MPTTPKRNYPFPALQGEPPNIPSALEKLAVAIENDYAKIDFTPFKNTLNSLESRAVLLESRLSQVEAHQNELHWQIIDRYIEPTNYDSTQKENYYGTLKYWHKTYNLVAYLNIHATQIYSWRVANKVSNENPRIYAEEWNRMSVSVSFKPGSNFVIFNVDEHTDDSSERSKLVKMLVLK